MRARIIHPRAKPAANMSHRERARVRLMEVVARWRRFGGSGGGFGGLGSVGGGRG